MKKTAIFLVITLLATMLSGVISASAEEWVETFPLSATEETVIFGNQFTDCGLGKTHTSIDSYYNTAGVYWYATAAAWNWTTYDVSLEAAGLYRVTIWGDANQGDTAFRLYRAPLNAAKIPASGMKATEPISTCVIDSNIGGGLDNAKPADLGVIDLPAGTTTIGLKNVGANRCNITKIVFTPVNPETDDVKITRSLYDVSSTDITVGMSRNDNEMLTVMSNTNKTVTYNIDVPQTANYKISMRYKSQYDGETSTTNVNRVVEVSVDDVLTGSFWFPAKSTKFQTAPLGIVNLEKGNRKITVKTTVDQNIGTLYIEKCGANEEATNLIKSTADSTVIPYADSATVIYGNAIKDFSYNVTAETAGKYDIYMNIAVAISGNRGIRIKSTVNGVEQSFFETAELPEREAAGNYGYFYKKVGTVTLPEGTSNLLIQSYGNDAGIEICYYLRDFKLVKSGTEILAKDYTDETPAFTVYSLNPESSHTTNGTANSQNVVQLTSGQSVTYNVTAEETGIHSVKLLASSPCADATITLTSSSGKSTTEKVKFSQTQGYGYVNAGSIVLPEGQSTLTITLDSGILADIYKINVSKPEIKLYNVNENNVAKAITEITVTEDNVIDRLRAKADLDGAYAGKDVLYAIAVYDESKALVGANCQKFMATGKEIKSIDLTSLNLDPNKEYTAKVFLWENASLFGNCKSY